MSQRVRRRYLALKVFSGKPPDEKDVRNVIWNAILQLFGEYGTSQANLSLIEYNPQKSQAILRCSHKALEMVRASIASITDINGKPTVFYLLGVSGTLKALRKKALLKKT